MLYNIIILELSFFFSVICMTKPVIDFMPLLYFVTIIIKKEND